MTGARAEKSNGTLKRQFSSSASEDQLREKHKAAAPFSIRFTDKERAILAREAGTLSLAAHIRTKLFGDAVSRRRSRNPSRKPQRPSVDRQALGRVLGELGKSRLASNMNQIAKAANMGALPVTPELLSDLKNACADIRTMRAMLIGALGLGPEDSQ